MMTETIFTKSVREALQKQDSQLFEVMKFTSNMKQAVLAESDKFLVGVEYEFHIEAPTVSSYRDQEGFDLSSQAVNEFVETMNRIPSETSPELVVSLDTVLGLDDDYFVDLFEDPDDTDESISEAINTLFLMAPSVIESLRRAYRAERSLRSVVGSVANLLMDNDNMAMLFDIHQEDTIAYDLVRGVSVDTTGLNALHHALNERYISGPDVLADVLRNFGTPETVSRVIRQTALLIEDDIRTHIGLEYATDPSVIRSTAEYMIERLRATQAYSRDEINELGLQYVNETLPEFLGGLAQHIRNIELDGSVKHGVEVITKPVPLKTQIQIMNAMSDYIVEYEGHTSNRTGMHVNISHEAFASREINTFHIIALLDPAHLHRTNGVKLKYPVRSYVSNIETRIQLIVGDLINHMADKPVKQMSFADYKEMLDSIDDLMSRHIEQKGWTANFSHLGADQIDQRRIEFRYFGGEDYEMRMDEMVEDILFAMHIVKAGVEPNYMVRQVYEYGMRVINRASLAATGMSFLDAVSHERKQRLERLPQSDKPRRMRRREAIQAGRDLRNLGIDLDEFDLNFRS